MRREGIADEGLKERKRGKKGLSSAKGRGERKVVEDGGRGISESALGRLRREYNRLERREGRSIGQVDVGSRLTGSAARGSFTSGTTSTALSTSASSASPSTLASAPGSILRTIGLRGSEAEVDLEDLLGGLLLLGRGFLLLGVGEPLLGGLLLLLDDGDGGPLRVLGAVVGGTGLGEGNVQLLAGLGGEVLLVSLSVVLLLLNARGLSSLGGSSGAIGGLSLGVLLALDLSLELLLALVGSPSLGLSLVGVPGRSSNSALALGDIETRRPRLPAAGFNSYIPISLK